MKAFYFLSAVCGLGIGDGIYIPFGKDKQIDAAPILWQCIAIATTGATL